MELDQTAPAPSTPTTPIEPPTPPSASLASLSPSERDTWRMTGELPKTSASAPVVAADPNPDPDPQVSAAPAPTTPEPPRQISKRQQQTNDYERRIAEQAAEIARLRAPHRPDPPPAPAPAPASAPPAEKFPTYDAYLATNPDASLEAWMDARDEWRDAKATAAAQARAEAAQQTAQQQTRAAKFSTAIADRVKTDPAFLTKVSQDVLGLRLFADLQEGERGGPLNIVAEELLDSPVAPALMEHLTAHPEDLQRLAACRSPREVIRELALLENRVDGAAAAPDAPPPPNTVTNAPSPGTFLGQRAATPADAVEGAIRAKDAGAYIREANARELAALRK